MGRSQTNRGHKSFLYYLRYTSHQILFKMVNLLAKHDFKCWTSRWRHFTPFSKCFSHVWNILAHNIDTFGPITRLSKGIIASYSRCWSSYFWESLYIGCQSLSNEWKPCIPLLYIATDTYFNRWIQSSHELSFIFENHCIGFDNKTFKTTTTKFNKI